jgi:uncharacterized protein YdcH (DUF465 family)
MKQATRVTVRDLEAQHREIDRQIKKLNHRGQHMLPSERAMALELKKLRLAAKDRLASLS